MKIKKYFTLLILLFLTMQAFAYNINTGDVLHLEVFGEDELTLDVAVDAGGYIQYPFVGKVMVEGMDVSEVKNEVLTRLKDGYFINPQVLVIVKEYQPFFIQGEVENPGPYPFEVGLTVSKAIILAGGLTERASKKKIYLTRANDEEKQQVKVSMQDEVSSGDIILIKESFF